MNGVSDVVAILHCFVIAYGFYRLVFGADDRMHLLGFGLLLANIAFSALRIAEYLRDITITIAPQ